jgi:hypothetical protein
MESLDYRYFRICINKSSAKTDKDGRVKIIVSGTNPGLPNWIDTCSHNEGTMCLRWYRLKGKAKPFVPDCKVVKISEIANDE